MCNQVRLCVQAACWAYNSAMADVAGHTFLWVQGAAYDGQTLVSRQLGPTIDLFPPCPYRSTASLIPVFSCRLECAAAGCYALSRLLDEGVIAGCEGDICSALGMLWGRLLTGQVPWMANVAQVGR